MKKPELQWHSASSLAHRLMHLIKEKQMDSDEWKIYESLYGGKEGLKAIIKRQLELDKKGEKNDHT